ncbi:hypothetical protein CDIK_4174 [Cucumispora dikerogammari]|nr:hypothetical protein CDIK_4174 [Cucumispora dikerogammari]
MYFLTSIISTILCLEAKSLSKESNYNQPIVHNISTTSKSVLELNPSDTQDYAAIELFMNSTELMVTIPIMLNKPFSGQVISSSIEIIKYKKQKHVYHVNDKELISEKWVETNLISDKSQMFSDCICLRKHFTERDSPKIQISAFLYSNNPMIQTPDNLSIIWKDFRRRLDIEGENILTTAFKVKAKITLEETRKGKTSTVNFEILYQLFGFKTNGDSDMLILNTDIIERD